MSLKEQLLPPLEASLIKGRIDRRDFIRFMGAAGLFGTGVLALADTLDGIRANQIERSKTVQASYDYNVCGTGSAGWQVAGSGSCGLSAFGLPARRPTTGAMAA